MIRRLGWWIGWAMERIKSWSRLEKALLSISILLIILIGVVFISRIIGYILLALFVIWFAATFVKYAKRGELDIPAIPFYMRRTSGRMKHRR